MMDLAIKDLLISYRKFIHFKKDINHPKFNKTQIFYLCLLHISSFLVFASVLKLKGYGISVNFKTFFTQLFENSLVDPSLSVLIGLILAMKIMISITKREVKSAN